MVAFWSHKNEGLIVASTDFVYNAEGRTTQPFVFQFSSLFKIRNYSWSQIFRHFIQGRINNLQLEMLQLFKYLEEQWL